MFESGFCRLACQSERAQIYKHDVAIRPTGNNCQPAFRKRAGENASVHDRLPRVYFERGIERFAESDCLGSNNMH